MRWSWLTASVSAASPPKRGNSRQPVRTHRRIKGGSKGFDAGKKISGRKRYILTDTDGRLLAVQVHGADIQSLPSGLTRGTATAARAS